jgi:hypothetical protein
MQNQQIDSLIESALNEYVRQAYISDGPWRDHDLKSFASGVVERVLSDEAILRGALRELDAIKSHFGFLTQFEAWKVYLPTFKEYMSNGCGRSRHGKIWPSRAHLSSALACRIGPGNQLPADLIGAIVIHVTQDGIDTMPIADYLEGLIARRAKRLAKRK